MQLKSLLFKCTPFLFCCLLTLTVSAQEKINQTDAQGKKQGKWQKTSNLGYKIYEGEFKDNYEIDTFTYYYPNGKPKMILSYSDKGVHAKCKVFNEEGKLVSEGQYENKKKSGIWLFYNQHGVKIVQESYKQGLKDGEWILYDEKGVVEKTTWKADKRNGAWYKMFDIGYLNASYKNDLLSGVYEEYYKNKTLKTKGVYLNGAKNSEWNLYDLNGALIITETFQQDEMISAKIVLKLTSGETVTQPINDIAYFYLSGANTVIVPDKGNKLTCIGDVTEYLTEYMDPFGFRLVNLKKRFYAKRSAIVRCQGEPESGVLEVVLKPQSDAKVYTDEEGQKSMNALFKNE